jgi:hypothetical protein
MKAGDRCAALACVDARVTAVRGSDSRLISAVGRGVVVTSWRGRTPSRRPNCRLSKAASGWRHFASSSHQAASNCGPRSCSGSSAENTCATAPFGHSSRRRDEVHCGRSGRGQCARIPDGPSIITSRASCAVSPTSAMLSARCPA